MKAHETTHTYRGIVTGIRITVEVTVAHSGDPSDEEENETVAQGEGRFREAWGGEPYVPKGSGSRSWSFYANKEV